MTKLVQKLGTQRTADMIDVLISCSRKDIEFTQRLHHELPAHLVASLARYIMGNGQTIGDEDRAYIDLDSHKRT